jgi:hypothetical protein
MGAGSVCIVTATIGVGTSNERLEKHDHSKQRMSCSTRALRTYCSLILYWIAVNDFQSASLSARLFFDGREAGAMRRLPAYFDYNHEQ